MVRTIFISALVGIPLVLYVFLAITRKFKYPQKTFHNALFETLLLPLRIFKLGPFKHGWSLAITLDLAKQKTNLDDYGDPHFIESYKELMNSKVYRAQRFSNIGYLVAHSEISEIWVRRLRFVDYLKRVPEVKNVPVVSPVFILGLPRTGSTLLFRLLALDPAIRAPYLWEFADPVPSVPPSASNEDKLKDRDERKQRIKELLAQQKGLGDVSLDNKHEISYDLPEECLIALSDEIPLGMQFLHACNMIPDFLLNLDTLSAYQHHKQMLQLLSFQVGEVTNPRRWVLKCPYHIFNVKSIATVFPDAKFIW